MMGSMTKSVIITWAQQSELLCYTLEARRGFWRGEAETLSSSGSNPSSDSSVDRRLARRRGVDLKSAISSSSSSIAFSFEPMLAARVEGPDVSWGRSRDNSGSCDARD